MKLNKLERFIALALAVFVVLAFGWYNFILDWDAKPYCHKQIYTGFEIWMHGNGVAANSYTNAFPNVTGVGSKSLDAIRENMGGSMDWTNGYRYVPGLREGDPGDLVLMYYDRQTRWTWHGVPPTIFKKREWIIVPVDFKFGASRPTGPGELSERVSPQEFRSRLKRTLDFVRTNERPNWQNVIAEHTAFLNSIQPR